MNLRKFNFPGSFCWIILFIDYFNNEGVLVPILGQQLIWNESDGGKTGPERKTINFAVKLAITGDSPIIPGTLG